MRLDQNAIDLLACPRCAGALSRVPQLDPVPDALACDVCRVEFPVVRGVPRFVASENYAASFGLQWNRHPRTQLDSFTGQPISRDRVRATTRWPDRLEGEVILEAGSGAGRFTEVLLTTGAMVYSFDYSSAVDANFATHGASDRLCLVQGDLLAIPLKAQAFDKVFCLGVLQHTPDPERAFRNLAARVKPGGEIAIDIYAKRLTAIVSWKYVLRPLTKRLPPERLYRLVERLVDRTLPLAMPLRRVGGRIGARLLPIVEYSHLGLPPAVNREWAVLDTFDMYAPQHDHPRTIRTVTRWFRDAGFTEIDVGRGLNGIVGRGRRT